MGEEKLAIAAEDGLKALRAEIGVRNCVADRANGAVGRADLPPASSLVSRTSRLAIKRDLENAGPHYPRDEVRNILAYWYIEL